MIDIVEDCQFGTFPSLLNLQNHLKLYSSPWVMRFGNIFSIWFVFCPCVCSKCYK